MTKESDWLHEHLNAKNRRAPVPLERFGRRNLAKVFKKLGYQSGAEIGVADGRNSKVLLETVPNLKLLCVDPWLRYRGNPRGGPQAQHDGNYEIAQRVLVPLGGTLVRAMSMDAVRDVPMESLDFIHIDGHHSFDWVMQDIIEWSRRVRRGGIVSGHDYYEFEWAGVVPAVNAYVLAHGITEWFVTREREPTWFWAKP